MSAVGRRSLGNLGDRELITMRDAAARELDRWADRDLHIDMARGKPAPDQLDESRALLALPGPDDYLAEDGTDCRTYGGSAYGLPEARRLLAPLVGMPPEQVVVADNSSIALIYDSIGYAFLHGTPDSKQPWRLAAPVRFICPVPGYDFHFSLLAEYGIEMISVPLTGQGPDMEIVERLVSSDPNIKGFLGVPRFSNPTGETYSARCIARLAGMRAAAPDFRLFLDNAYAVHHLGKEPAEPLENAMDAAVRVGQPNRPILFASTSKITFPGAGLAVMGSSAANISWFIKHASRRSIGPNKINQLRHVRFLHDWRGLRQLMARHAKHLAPKFSTVDAIFTKTLRGAVTFADWKLPRGGYFISLYTPPGCAAATIACAAQHGVTLTPAGAAYPYGVDPEDHHIRIAPTVLKTDAVADAASVVAWSLRFVACKTELVKRGLSN